MTSAAISISLNVVSNFLFDLLKGAGAFSRAPIDAAIARTVDCFPAIVGLKETLEEWLLSADVQNNLDDYTKGLIGVDNLSIGELAEVLVNRTQFFLPDGGEVAHQIVSRFLLEIRECYLSIPERGLPILANRMEEGFRQSEAKMETIASLLK